ncbi:hypothetical protein LTR66_004820, partial [Elasticomyces elasticus]
MSQEEKKLSKAEKKAQRSEERHKKSKGRKRHREEAAALPEQHDEPTAPPSDAQQVDVKEPKKKRKKRSHDAASAQDVTKVDTQTATLPLATSLETPTSHDTATADGSPTKKRKRSKSKADAGETEPTNPADTADQPSATATANPPSKQRFIVFIGNLPYATTTASIQSHFSSISPLSIRHLTEPTTGRSKGFAFLEFAAYDRMKTCLKLYHHTDFDDGKGGKRRINVELTAGGGGKGKERMEKVKGKNGRLEEQRKRRAELEGKERRRGEGGGKGDERGDGARKDVQEEEKAEDGAGS